MGTHDRFTEIAMEGQSNWPEWNVDLSVSVSEAAAADFIGQELPGLPADDAVQAAVGEALMAVIELLREHSDSAGVPQDSTGLIHSTPCAWDDF